MSVNFTKHNPVASQENITKFEDKFKLTLPDDYSDFLLRINGGIIKPLLVNVDHEHSETEFVLLQLYGIDNNEGELSSLSLIKVNEIYRDAIYALPINYVVIGEVDGGHHEVIISLNENDYGTMYLWMYTLPDELEFIASSFDSFLQMLVKLQL
jgi:hypothetical protein